MTTDLAPVKFSRLSRRGVLLGLSPSQLATVGFAAVTLVIALYAGGTSALAIAVPIIGACTTISFLKVGGQPVVAWLPIGAIWLRRSATSQLDYRLPLRPPRRRPGH